MVSGGENGCPRKWEIREWGREGGEAKGIVERRQSWKWRSKEQNGKVGNRGGLRNEEGNNGQGNE